MRQAGYLAAAGIYALENNIERLKEDNQRAKRLGDALAQLPYVANVRPVQSNICIFDLAGEQTATDFLDKLADNSILATPFGLKTIRFTTHLHLTDGDIDLVIKVLKMLAE